MGTNKDNNSKIGNSNNENQIKNISNEKLIELKGVGVSFPPFVALEDISFDIFSTDYLGIIGRNGSGKTTLVRTILGLQTASSGSITIKNGIKMGYLPQIPAKRYKNFPANVNEIILSGFDKKTSKQVRKTQFEKATTRMNISHMLGKRIGDLSGGELQRVLLARTIISNPDILFLDEPTSALDPKIREQFYEIVDGLNKELGTAIVLISHDHSSICKHAKHIMELDKKIIFYGEACGFDHTMSHTMTGRSVTDIMPILPRESSAFFREEGQGDKQVGVELSSDQGTNTPGNNGKVSESRQFMGKMPSDNASVKEGRNGDY